MKISCEEVISSRKVRNAKCKDKHDVVEEEAPKILEKMSEIIYRKGKNIPEFTLNTEIIIFASGDIISNENETDMEDLVETSSIVQEKDFNFCLRNEYEDDSYLHDRRMEQKYSLPHNFFVVGQINPVRREIILNYLLQFCNFLQISTEILHLSVTIFDRFLQKAEEIPEELLKLSVVATIRIALKLGHVQIDLPETSDIVLLTGDDYPPWKILAMEKKICHVLEFNLLYPTPYSFLRRFDDLIRMSELQRNLAMYLLEINILNYKTFTIKPSLQVAAACCFSVAFFRNETVTNIWTTEMEYITFYSIRTINSIIQKMINGLIVMGKSGLKSTVCKKYSQQKYFFISTFEEIYDIDLLKKFL
ncbi:G2/mitotic-specific cyclin S13-7-like [Harmonia axyridis]|uniref:G2/mitotic-specific cyclin S13-7-like n=1 Tax=Harmonia axyridis TaxID=115357 RepID=UPI001E27841F|nr:G2/mitotic-specific cyclin S13-7-like [Harmonia axyridis]XP_045478985.1 G2/mitotic-specific cyclin S13-7-like [Harmonia axyridis]